MGELELFGANVAEDARAGAGAFVPERAALAELREAARGAQGCDLYRHATQTVFGEGPERAQHRREELVAPLAGRVAVTVHPSSILRATDEGARAAAYAEFVDDLRWIAGIASQS